MQNCQIFSFLQTGFLMTKPVYKNSQKRLKQLKWWFATLNKGSVHFRRGPVKVTNQKRIKVLYIIKIDLSKMSDDKIIFKGKIATAKKPYKNKFFM